MSHAVIFLQTRCILHRDIKPGNVCVKSAGQPLATAPYSLAARPTAILCDFGLARDIAPTQSLLPDSTTNIHGLLHKGEPLTEKVCTLWYRAPEIIQRKGYVLPSDLWSLGLVFVRIAVGRHVFKGPALRTNSSCTVRSARLPIRSLPSLDSGLVSSSWYRGY